MPHASANFARCTKGAEIWPPSGSATNPFWVSACTHRRAPARRTHPHGPSLSPMLSGTDLETPSSFLPRRHPGQNRGTAPFKQKRTTQRVSTTRPQPRGGAARLVAGLQGRPAGRGCLLIPAPCGVACSLERARSSSPPRKPRDDGRGRGDRSGDRGAGRRERGGRGDRGRESGGRARPGDRDRGRDSSKRIRTDHGRGDLRYGLSDRASFKGKRSGKKSKAKGTGSQKVHAVFELVLKRMHALGKKEQGSVDRIDALLLKEHGVTADNAGNWTEAAGRDDERPRSKSMCVCVLGRAHVHPLARARARRVCCRTAYPCPTCCPAPRVPREPALARFRARSHGGLAVVAREPRAPAPFKVRPLQPAPR